MSADQLSRFHAGVALAGTTIAIAPTTRAVPRDWRLLAACRSADPDLFFPAPESGRSLEQVAAAKAVCSGCQMQRECLAFALAAGEAHGIWGGRSERERHLTGRAACTRA